MKLLKTTGNGTLPPIHHALAIPGQPLLLNPAWHCSLTYQDGHPVCGLIHCDITGYTTKLGSYLETDVRFHHMGGLAFVTVASFGQN